MKEGRHIKIKQVLLLLHFGTWRILRLLFSLDLVLFSVWRITLLICQCPFEDISLLIRDFYLRPIGHRHLQIVTC